MRLEIVKRLQLSGDPLSATRLGEMMRQGATKLHYHLVELERLGIIRVAEKRKKGNLIEKCYAPTAEVYHVDQSLFKQGSAGLEALHDTVASVLEATSDEIRRLLEQGGAAETLASEVLPMHTAFTLSDSDAASLRSRLRDLLVEFKDKQVKKGVETAVTIVVYPEPSGASASQLQKKKKLREQTA